MACRKCGTGQSVVLPAPASRREASDEPMVVLEYVGGAIQFQRVRSKVHPDRFYRFGGEPGSDTRRFAVYAPDAAWLLSSDNFVRVPLHEDDTVQLVTDRRPEDRSAMSLSASIGPYTSKRAIYVLTGVGIETVGDLARADAHVISEEIGWTFTKTQALIELAQRFLAGELEPVTRRAKGRG